MGASLALLGAKVLIIDIDPQGNATTGVGVDKQHVAHDVYSVLLNDVGLDEAMTETAVEGLWAVAATINLAGAEIELVAALSRENRLKAALAAMERSFDFVLIDCPPSLGLLTVNALAAASEVIIPVQAEYYALEGLSQLTMIIGRVQAALNPGLVISGVLITMFDPRTRLAGEVLDEVHRYFPEQVYKTQIPRNIRLSEAPSYGKPVALFDGKSRGAQAYMALAREVVTGRPPS